MNLTQFIDQRRPQWQELQALLEQVEGSGLRSLGPDGAVQFARLYYESLYKVQGDHYVEYSNGRPTQIREFNTPTNPKNIEHMLGFFAQDSWTLASRLTLNLGLRVDHNTGILPAQSNVGNAFIGPLSIEQRTRPPPYRY